MKYDGKVKAMAYFKDGKLIVKQGGVSYKPMNNGSFKPCKK